MEIKLWGPALAWAGGGVWPPCRRIPGVGAALTGPAYNEKLLIYHSDKTSRSFVTTTCPRQGHGTRWELICRVVLQRWRPASQNFDFPRWDGQGHWTWTRTGQLPKYFTTEEAMLTTGAGNWPLPVFTIKHLSIHLQWSSVTFRIVNKWRRNYSPKILYKFANHLLTAC